jgi:hypothetical protein
MTGIYSQLLPKNPTSRASAAAVSCRLFFGVTHPGVKNVMSRKIIVLVVFVQIAVSGCTNKQIYESTQPKYNQAECMKLPQSQYEECMNRDTETYEEYEKERHENSNH